MKYELSKCIVDSIIELDNNFDDGDESCFEASAQLIHDIASELKSQDVIAAQEKEDHIQNLIDSIS